MALASHACRCIAHRQFRTSSTLFWIGDDYLSSVLDHFTNSKTKPCVRHGSSVPGPLEARKRAAKRRMMNMASNVSGGGGEGVRDGRVLWGMGQSWGEKDLRWEPPTPPDQLYTQPSDSRRGWKKPTTLPDWLETYDAEASEHQLIHSEAQDLELDNLSLSETLDTKKSDLESELRQSQTIDAIRKVAFQHSVVLAHSAAHSLLGFSNLLNAQSSLPTLIEYLEDRKLNAPDGNNLFTLMSWPNLQKQPNHELDQLETWIERGIALGQFSEYNITSLLRGVAQQNKNGYQLKSSRAYVWSVFKRIWAGIQASEINGLRQLKLRTVMVLLQFASQAPALTEARDIAACILVTRHEIVRQDQASVASSIANLSGTDQPRLKKRPYTTIAPSFVWLLPVLRECPQPETNSIITGLSAVLTYRAVGKNKHLSVSAQEWFSTVRSEDFQQARMDEKWAQDWWLVERNLANLKQSTIATYLRLIVARQRYIFLLRTWIPLRWPAAVTDHYVLSKIPAKAASWQQFVQRIELESFYPGVEPDVILLDIIKSIHREYPSLLRTVVPELFPILRLLNQSSAILRISQYLRKASPQQLPNETLATEVAQHVSTDLTLAYKLFKSGSRLQLEDCPGLAEAVITDPSMDSSEILQFMKRKGGMIGSVDLTEHPTDLLKITPERVSLLHTIATAFANAPHLEPRKAYRKVRRCLQYFRDRHDLIRPEMARALALAGIRRYLDVGLPVSDYRLDYIMDIVRGIEGEEAAHELDRQVWEWRARSGKGEHMEWSAASIRPRVQ